MKKKLCFLFIFAILGGLIMNSCSTGDEKSNALSKDDTTSSLFEESSNPQFEKKVINLSDGATYYYGHGAEVSGDTAFDVLNNPKNESSVKLKTNISKDDTNTFNLNYTDWYQKTHTVSVENEYASIYFDLGFVHELTEINLDYDFKGEFKFVQIFGSDDGYNFTKYLGSFTDKNIKLKDKSNANIKALRFDFRLNFGEEISIKNIDIFGYNNDPKICLNDGAKYKWFGSLINGFSEGMDQKLLDGKTDQYVGRKMVGLIADFGAVKDCSEVLFDLLLPNNANYSLAYKYKVDYSTDGKTYYNLGESYLQSSVKSDDGIVSRYFVTRNNTVKAQFIKITAVGTPPFICNEIYLFGAKSQVEEPKYDFILFDELSYTNTAESANITLNSEKSALYNDKKFFDGINSKIGENTLEMVYTESKNLCGISVVTSAPIKCGVLRIDEKDIQYKVTSNKVSDKLFYSNLYFDATKGKNAVLIFSAETIVSLSELLIYENQAHIPAIDGGFFQLPTNGGEGDAALSSEYSWYLQLKGMRDLGMKYVVIQYSANFIAKTTLINGKRITDAGYKFNNTYGVPDVAKTVLDAAEKLGMQVYLGTMHDSDFNNTSGMYPTYEAIVSDAKLMIADIDELYGKHPAFAGYYLSDETCDYWLNLEGGVAACRFVYKGQSDEIRKIAPDKKIMIAPAIWRAGDTVKAGENMYDMIKPETEGGLPIVDIVAAQDCLGREGTLFVPDKAYNDYMSYLQEWAVGVRRAGADFWHDAEVFEITGAVKRYDEIIKSLICEAPVSGTTIVFDIPHYFPICRLGTYNDSYIYHKELEVRDYIRYFSELRNILKK